MTAFIDTWRARLDSFPQPLLQLLMRFSIFWVFWRSGNLKADNLEQAIVLFREEYKLPLVPPELAACLATATELGAPCLILVGLFTRLATLPLIGDDRHHPVPGLLDRISLALAVARHPGVHPGARSGTVSRSTR